MEIVHLPLGRLSASAERSAMRNGLFQPAARPPLRVMQVGRTSSAYCVSCARPIEFGAVWRGELAFCSVECSLGGDRPA
jgi:hypothetical protein